MAITNLPAPPSRSDPTNFADRADTFLGALPAFVVEANTLADDLNTKTLAAAGSATDAQSSEDAATAAANLAIAAAGSTGWVSAQAYTKGAVVWSPLNLWTYRARNATSGTIDPSADQVNWEYLNGGYFYEEVTTVSKTAVRNGHYFMTNVAQSTLILPASANLGDKVKVTFVNGRVDNIINNNGIKIMGRLEVLNIDQIDGTVELVYINSVLGWRITV